MDALELFRTAATPKVEPVEVGGHTFHVRGLTAIARAAYLRMYAQALSENSLVPDNCVVAWGLCNADGTPLPGTGEEKLAALEGLDGQVLATVARKILELSGFRKGAVEEAEKYPKPAGATVPAPAGTGSRKDRRAAAARTRSVRRRG